MGVADRLGRRAQAAVGVARDHHVLAHPHAVRVGRDPAHALPGHQVGVRHSGAGHDLVVGSPGAVDELDQVEPGHPGQPPQVGDLEALDDDGRVAGAYAVAGQGVEQRLLRGQAGGREEGAVLDLRDHAERLAGARGGAAGEGEDLVEGGHLVEAVVGRVVGAHLRQALLRTQRLELGQGEVLDEPAGDRAAVDLLGGAASGELRVGRDVRGAADLRLVPRHEDAVAGHHQVGLDEVRALAGSELVGGDGVLGPVAGRAAVGEHRGTAGRDALAAHLDPDDLDVVGLAVDPRVVAGEVVVVGEHEAAVAQLHHGLVGDEREGEGVAGAVSVTGADATGVGQVEQVEHRLRDQVAARLGAAEVDLDDALGHRLGAAEVVALEQQHPPLAGHEGVTDQVGRLDRAVDPRPAGVAQGAGVELVDPAHALVGLRDERPLEDRVGVAGAVVRRRLEALAGRQGRLGAAEVGVLRRLDARERDGGVEQDAVVVEVQEVGAELVADQEAAVAQPDHRLDVEVGAGEQPLLGVLVHDRERHLAVRVGEGDVARQVDAAVAAEPLEVRAHEVHPQEEVGGVALGAEAVVGHRPERAVAVVEHRGEAGDHLAGERARAPVGGGHLRAGRRAGGEVVGVDRGAADEGGHLDGPAVAVAVAVIVAAVLAGARGVGGAGEEEGADQEAGEGSGSERRTTVVGAGHGVSLGSEVRAGACAVAPGRVEHEDPVRRVVQVERGGVQVVRERVRRA
ncbi:hypothetical protein NOCA1190040 [metagenome]|uniref:Uncharacterized protein n=1 Tax=metagenome TaxID=256318 RepID=A0A2P2CCH6_9ZZZZ